jgi:DNA-binding transcriptional regulator GbsR (MarR family)
MKRLDEAEHEVVVLWEDLAEARGFDRVVGRVISILLIEGAPLSQQELAEKTGYSVPTISKTLKTLTSLGSVRKTKQPGKRLTLYYADMRPSEMLSGALRSWVILARTIERRVTLISQKLENARAENPDRAEKLRKIVIEFTASIPKMIEIMERVIKDVRLN